MAIRVRNGSVSVVYRDEHRRQRTAGGFRNKTEARQWENRKLEEVRARKRGDKWEEPQEIPTLDQLVDGYLETHVATENTKRTIRERCARLRKAFGDQRVDRIPYSELRAWAAKVSEGSRYGTLKVVRQVFRYASIVYKFDNPAAELDLGEELRREVQVFEADEIDRICEHLTVQDAAMVRLAYATGLRMEELLALERKDIDRENRVLHVRQTYCRGVLREQGKTKNSLRPVPLTSSALAALNSLTPNLVNPKLLPAKMGGYQDLHNWRTRVWTPALEDAAVPHRGPGCLRHSFISRAIWAGIPLAEIATKCGTSVKMIERTYHRQIRDADARFVGKLEAFEAAEQAQRANG